MRLRLPAGVQGKRPARRGRRLLTAVACAGFAVVVSACTITPPSQPPKVILYGDSLSVESASSFSSRIQQGGVATPIVRAATNTGTCDFFDEMEADLQNIRPTAVLLEFSGNSAPACVSGSGMAPIDKYKQDAQHFIDIFKPQGVVVYLVSTPVKVVGSGSPETPDPWRDMYFGLAVQNDVRFADAGHALFNFAAGKYTMKLPCGSGEGAEQGCVNGQIQVRDPRDGLHFCAAGTRPLPCAGYNSGAVRYGTSMGDTVASQLGF